MACSPELIAARPGATAVRLVHEYLFANDTAEANQNL